MTKYGLVSAIVLAVGCIQSVPASGISASNRQVEVSSQSLSVTGVVDRLFAEISALAKDYPELGQFPEKARPLQEDGRVEVRFSHNVKGFSEMRETRPTDLGTNGIEMVFMVLFNSYVNFSFQIYTL